MPRFQAQHIEQLPAGARVEIKGRAYLRLEDNEDRHITGWIADLETGWIGSWVRLCLWNEMVVGLASEV